MRFNSLVFVLFAAVVLPLAHAVPARVRNPLLLVASYAFYGWWDPRFLALLAFSTLTDYWAARRIEASPAPRTRKAWMAASVLVNLGVLAVFKYHGFFIDTFAAVLTSLGFAPNLPFLQVALPIGLSFYTLQTLAYTIDVYRGQMKACDDPIGFALYVAFFPQLVAGPIERARHLLPQLLAPRPLTGAMLRSGVALVLIGWLKKVGIADGIGPVVDEVFADIGAYSASTVWIAAAAFGIQVYGDFSGYSDMARGLARLLGVELSVNFRQPFLSGDVAELWRNWHITLSAWFRDYVYLPLGGHASGVLRRSVVLLTVFGLSGLWHGASWTYVGWGLFNGFAVLGYRAWRASPWVAGPLSPWHPRRWVGTLLTFGVFALPLPLFRAGTEAHAWVAVAAGIYNPLWLGYEPMYLLPLALYALPVLALDLWQRATGDEEPMLRWGALGQGVFWGVVGLWVLVMGGVDADVPFVYFQF